ncbi:hypothetical protein EVAR_49346_1 [Eumeta japonica]|uniref:Uncharacterized protein n=1 Tax=Eumeta variegata TaxID=151549 RepID=A0A4C1XWK6_EUMVA|nr:hypothetical protein EVAR_49346_1 [Eumeta japonica]
MFYKILYAFTARAVPPGPDFRGGKPGVCPERHKMRGGKIDLFLSSFPISNYLCPMWLNEYIGPRVAQQSLYGYFSGCVRIECTVLNTVTSVEVSTYKCQIGLH